MAKVALIIVAVLVLGVLVLASPFIYLGLKDGIQCRKLQSRSDYPQIAAAAAALAHAVTNDSELVSLADPRVPPLLRSLSPRYITASSNHITIEFHGGFDHYGYRIRRSDTNRALWNISWYTEKAERLLTTISR